MTGAIGSGQIGSGQIGSPLPAERGARPKLGGLPLSEGLTGGTVLVGDRDGDPHEPLSSGLALGEGLTGGTAEEPATGGAASQDGRLTSGLGLGDGLTGGDDGDRLSSGTER